MAYQRIWMQRSCSFLKVEQEQMWGSPRNTCEHNNTICNIPILDKKKIKKNSKLQPSLFSCSLLPSIQKLWVQSHAGCKWWIGAPAPCAGLWHQGKFCAKQRFGPLTSSQCNNGQILQISNSKTNHNEAFSRLNELTESFRHNSASLVLKRKRSSKGIASPVA